MRQLHLQNGTGKMTLYSKHVKNYIVVKQSTGSKHTYSFACADLFSEVGTCSFTFL